MVLLYCDCFCCFFFVIFLFVICVLVLMFNISFKCYAFRLLFFALFPFLFCQYIPFMLNFLLYSSPSLPPSSTSALPIPPLLVLTASCLLSLFLSTPSSSSPPLPSSLYFFPSLQGICLSCCYRGWPRTRQTSNPWTHGSGECVCVCRGEGEWGICLSLYAIVSFPVLTIRSFYSGFPLVS